MPTQLTGNNIYTGFGSILVTVFDLTDTNECALLNALLKGTNITVYGALWEKDKLIGEVDRVNNTVTLKLY
jgi:hypothetical protein